jgi:YkoY family integral membrane protein
MFDQTFDPGDIATIGILVVLEGVLSIDNAVVLGVLAGRLEKSQRARALSYGLIGAMVLRLAVVAGAAYLIHWSILKLAGGIYLLWISGRFFLSRRRHGVPELEHTGPRKFWRVIAEIELTDLVFAVDSILAAVALVGPAPAHQPPEVLHPKLWVIVTGGMLGVVLMRFAAAIFVRLLEKFPGMQRSAYLLVMLIGLKLIADWVFNDAWRGWRVDFQDARTAPFWVFWGLMVICLGAGLRPSGRASGGAEV